MILKAMDFCANKHKGQERRGSGLPYMVHPMIVCELVLKYKGNSKHIDSLRTAALLHDTLEDTEATFQEISHEFSPMIAGIVLELTSEGDEIEKVGKNPYLIKKMLGMSDYALFVKLCDRLSNIMDNPSSKYVQDTRIMLNKIHADREWTDSQRTVVIDIYKQLVILEDN